MAEEGEHQARDEQQRRSAAVRKQLSKQTGELETPESREGVILAEEGELGGSMVDPE